MTRSEVRGYRADFEGMELFAQKDYSFKGFLKMLDKAAKEVAATVGKDELWIKILEEYKNGKSRKVVTYHWSKTGLTVDE